MSAVLRYNPAKGGCAVIIREFTNGNNFSVVGEEIFALFQSTDPLDQVAAVKFTARLVHMDRTKRVYGGVVPYALIKYRKLRHQASMWHFPVPQRCLYYSFVSNNGVALASELRVLYAADRQIDEDDRVQTSVDRHNQM